MKRLSLVLVAAAWVVGCSATPTVSPTKNMDRPTDMALVCLGTVTAVDGTTKVTGLPMSSCHQPGVVDPAISSNGHRVLGTFSFVSNATRGELAVADMDVGRLLDLTPAAPGYGLLPIGGDPEAVVSTKDGCWVATANRSTCDFSLLDPSQLLVGSFAQGGVLPVPATLDPSAGDNTSNHRIAVKTPSNKLILSAPGEISFLPSVDLPSLEKQTTCMDMPAPKAVVTFPSCDMVALLDFSFKDSTATIASAYYVRPDLPGGFQPVVGDPVCPNDCAPTALQANDVDASASNGGNALDAGVSAASSPWQLRPLALLPDGSRVYVAGLHDTAVTSLDVGPGGLSNPSRFLLAESPLGVSRIRLGVDPYLVGTTLSSGEVSDGFIKDRGKFLYAFAADGSVRVVNISDVGLVECDVNVVTTDLAAGQTKNQGCFPVGSARRRPLAQGPGLRIPTFTNPDSPPPLPRDLAFVDLRNPTQRTDGNYHALTGQFGFVIASNGQVYVVNLAPAGEDQTATHSFREARDVGQSVRTELTVSIAPQRSAMLSDQAFATTASFAASQGPTIRSFMQGSVTNWFGFPDPDYVISRSWTLTWEGTVPQTARENGIIKPVTAGNPYGILSDSGADFCDSGVRPGDVLMFAGCTQDVECQPDDKFSCQVTASGARGICLPRDGATTLALTSDPKCSRFFGSRMRYEVAQATPTSLALKPKLDEVPRTTLNPCTTNAQCQPDADHGSLSKDGPDGGGPGHVFECLEGHCVQRCRIELDSDCRAGNVCESVAEFTSIPSGMGLCVQAPPLDPSCFPQPMTAYSVRAGNSYMVYGSSLPRLHTSKVSATGTCELDQSVNPDLVDRIPLAAPECPEAFLAQATATQVVQQLSAFSPLAGRRNPCLYKGLHFDGDTGTTAGGSAEPPISAFFENSQIRFVLTNLEQYPGDLLSIHFEFQYGFVPLTVQIPSYEVLLTMPTQIFTGPTMTPESPIRGNAEDIVSYPYIYVVDQGHTRLTPGSRGQVLRINPRAGSNEIVTFDTALSGSTPFQLQ